MGPHVCSYTGTLTEPSIAYGTPVGIIYIQNINLRKGVTFMLGVSLYDTVTTVKENLLY